MTAKIYEIAFKVAGKLSGDFSKTFKSANQAVGLFSRNVSDMNKKAAEIDNVIRLKKEVALSARSYVQAKEKADQLAAALGRNGKPTREMIADYQKAKAAVDKAALALDRKRVALRKVESATGTAGEKIRDLEKRQENLASATDRARRAQEKLNKLHEKTERLGNVQSQMHGSAMSSAGTLAGMGAMATGTVGLPVKEAMAMEDAMAEVRKVVNFDEPDGLQKLQTELEKMSLRIPMSADGLAQIAAAAGQSGIAAKDLTDFTEQAAKMAVAFDIGADEAGTMMAKWQSGMGLTMDQTYKLADATNHLSNNNAAQAKQIGEVLMRYGALGKVAGLTETQTAAFAASVVASGAEADVAATGIKAFMRAMGKGGSMSKAQAAAFGNAGLDPKQLQKNLQKDAPKTIIQTLEAIQKKIPKEQWNQYLSVMFGEEAAVAVGPMMQNLDGIKENFAMVADEASYSGSMLDEFTARSATTSNALILAKNAALYAARAVGAPLLDPMKEAAAQFVKNAESVGQWIRENQAFVMSVLKVSGAVVASIAGFHVLRLALVFLVSPLVSLYKGFLNVRKAILWVRSSAIVMAATAKVQAAAMGAWRLVMMAVTAVMKSLRWAMMLLNVAMRLNPVGLVITALTALIAVGVLVYRNWDVIKAKAVELWGAFSSAFPNIAGVVKTQFGLVKDIAMDVWGVFTNLMGFIKNVFTGDWEAAWENVKGIFGNAFSALVGLVKLPFNSIISLVNGVIGSINDISVDIPTWVPKYGGQTFGLDIPTIPQLASGGIATAPTLAMIGEGREKEAVLPLSKLDALLSNASGISRYGSGSDVSVNLTVNVTGGTGEDVKRGIDAGTLNLKRELEKLLEKQRRLSYG